MTIGNLDNILKMNLQLLAGEGEEGNEQDPGDNGSDGGGEEVKTYTQEELDALLNDAKKDLPSNEELTKFKEWQESQKTESQKQNEKLENEIKAREEAEEKASRLEAKLICRDKGVPSKHLDNVINFAQTLVTDNLPLTGAIDKLLDMYPHFKEEKKEEEKKEKPGFIFGAPQNNALKDGERMSMKEAIAAKLQCVNN